MVKCWMWMKAEQLQRTSTIILYCTELYCNMFWVSKMTLAIGLHGLYRSRPSCRFQEDGMGKAALVIGEGHGWQGKAGQAGRAGQDKQGRRGRVGF